MPPLLQTPLIRLGNLFPRHAVYATCEFLAPSGCFRIRGATHLLEHRRREGRTRQLIVPSMGNTALGAVKDPGHHRRDFDNCVGPVFNGRHAPW
jgi:threonine dehydratase